MQRSNAHLSFAAKPCCSFHARYDSTNLTNSSQHTAAWTDGTMHAAASEREPAGMSRGRLTSEHTRVYRHKGHVLLTRQLCGCTQNCSARGRVLRERLQGCSMTRHYVW